jgi:hypothetical protein
LQLYYPLGTLGPPLKSPMSRVLSHKFGTTFSG